MSADLKHAALAEPFISELVRRGVSVDGARRLFGADVVVHSRDRSLLAEIMGRATQRGVANQAALAPDAGGTPPSAPTLMRSGVTPAGARQFITGSPVTSVDDRRRLGCLLAMAIGPSVPGGVARARTLLERDQTRHYSVAGPLSIPDHDPAGVTLHIDVPDHFALRELSVSIEITHAYAQDLRIDLLKSGRLLTIRNRHVGSGSRAMPSPFSHIVEEGWLVGLKSAGRWSLRVADLGVLDRGTLNRFGLTFTN